MEFKDLLVTPIFLILIYFGAYAFKRKVKDKNMRKYFIPALSVKLFGAVALGLIYFFYYKGGDSINFYRLGSVHVYQAFMDSPSAGLQLLLDNGEYENPSIYHYISRIYYYTDAPSFLVVKISAFFGLFCFHTYSTIALFFAVFSFTGSWALYTTFLKLYPKYYKLGAYAIFFVPSVFFWGSGLLKDSLSFGALGWFFYGFCNLLIFRRYIKRSVIFCIIGIFMLKKIKIYILLCVLPAMTLWIFLVLGKRFQSSIGRLLVKPAIFCIALVMTYFAAEFVSAEDKQYNLDNIVHTAKTTSDWLTYMSKAEGGAYYSLGAFDNSATGMLMKAPAAINVTLFRPYLWEAHNAVMLSSAIESFLILLITLYVILKLGLFKTIGFIRNDPFLIFCLIFSLTFSFAVGISTSNFGTLVRYKIPMLPFYLLLLTVLVEEAKKKKLMKKFRRVKSTRFQVPGGSNQPEQN
jgi:hypothetical protein